MTEIDTAADSVPVAEARRAFAALVPRSRSTVDPAGWAALDHVVSTNLACPAVGPDRPAGHAALESAAGPATRRFAEQFVVDVAGMSDEVRTGFGAEQGPRAFAVAQVIWVLDWTIRARAAWTQLGLPDEVALTDVALPDVAPAEPAGPEAELWPAMESFMAAVARLDAVDAVTTELVRLRGARTHDCRLCRSRRFVQALDAGADEATFDQVDHYETSTLAPSQQVALRLTDALIWTPSVHPAGLAEQVAQAFTPAQTVELVLDVVRNSANKIAVAFGADQAQVPDGQVELYDLAADGEVVYGLSRP